MRKAPMNCTMRLTWMGYLTDAEVAANPLWQPLIAGLVAESRAVLLPQSGTVTVGGDRAARAV